MFGVELVSSLQILAALKWCRANTSVTIVENIEQRFTFPFLGRVSGWLSLLTLYSQLSNGILFRVGRVCVFKTQ